jgi:hypothetical protein
MMCAGAYFHLQHTNGQTQFVDNVRSNTCRYVKLFEEVASTILPGANRLNRQMDVFDMLQVRDPFEYLFAGRC